MEYLTITCYTNPRAIISDVSCISTVGPLYIYGVHLKREDHVWLGDIIIHRSKCTFKPSTSWVPHNPMRQDQKKKKKKKDSTKQALN